MAGKIVFPNKAAFAEFQIELCIQDIYKDVLRGFPHGEWLSRYPGIELKALNEKLAEHGWKVYEHQDDTWSAYAVE